MTTTYNLIKNYFDNLNGKISKLEILKEKINRSKSGIYKALNRLLKEKYIFKDEWKYYGKK